MPLRRTTTSSEPPGEPARRHSRRAQEYDAVRVVQILGTYFVTHALKGASEAYGVFGLVLGLIVWIYLLALVTVFAVEVNVVAQRHLWPGRCSLRSPTRSS